METYSVNLEASQIVRWLIEEQRRGTLQLTSAATHSNYVVEKRRWKRLQLDKIGEEGEDLNDILAIGRLRSALPPGRWRGAPGPYWRTGTVQGCRMTRMRLKRERNSIFRRSKRILACPSAVQPRSFSKLKTRKPKPDFRVFNHMLRNEHRPHADERYLEG